MAPCVILLQKMLRLFPELHKRNSCLEWDPPHLVGLAGAGAKGVSVAGPRGCGGPSWGMGLENQRRGWGPGQIRARERLKAKGSGQLARRKALGAGHGGQGGEAPPQREGNTYLETRNLPWGGLLGFSALCPSDSHPVLWPRGTGQLGLASREPSRRAEGVVEQAGLHLAPCRLSGQPNPGPPASKPGSCLLPCPSSP